MKLISLVKIRRWDSSDPERAPPPLPLNPGSSSPVAKPNTSSAITEKAEALAAKAQSAYTINPSPSRSPERSLIKGQYHKRMQSLQSSHNGSPRDRTLFLDGLSSGERSPERLARIPAYDSENRVPERSPTRAGQPNGSSKDIVRDAPSLKPASRPPFKAILGENTPPSATMLALQNTPTPKELDTSLCDITNGSNATTKTPQTFEAISSQILSLTSIATNLQREMAQLSRRSKDNATDLISLKEATNLRDEDIRMCLRDLVSTISPRLIENGVDGSPHISNQYSRGPSLIESKPHVSPSGMPKSYSLPRIPSPNSFTASLQQGLATSPYNMDGAASIALLEKVLREMGTKEGQERLFAIISQMQERPKIRDGEGAVANKLEEILAFLKESTGSQALVTRRHNGNDNGERPPTLELEFDTRTAPLVRASMEAAQAGSESKKSHPDSGPVAGLVDEKVLSMLKKMKDSITEGGGMTAELKALVRELRGEVLGMGREIGRKLDQAEAVQREKNQKGDTQSPTPEDIAKIVEEGLLDLKDHMENIMGETRRQLTSSAVTRNNLDSQQVFAAVQKALGEIPFQQLIDTRNSGSGIERDEILDAVREAWETYKPEIELQNFGLERDEILQCLKEGLQAYQPQNETKDLAGATYEEVLDAVRQGLKHFQPPAPIETEPGITKDEIIMTVRQCLDSFEIPAPIMPAPKELEMNREDILDAVKEGVSLQPQISKEIELNRDELFEAIKAGLEEAQKNPMGGVGEQVLEKMQDLLDGIRIEFKQYSVANGGDTEQVLDALKDGLEVLRTDIETYVDRAADVTGKDEIIETVRDGLDHLRNDLEGCIAHVNRAADLGGKDEIIETVRDGFEQLRTDLEGSIVNVSRPADVAGKDEIIETVRDGLEQLRIELEGSIANVDRGADASGKDEIIETVRDGFEQLRTDLEGSIVNVSRPADVAGKDEIVETVRDGLEQLRVELEGSIANVSRDAGQANNGELLDALEKEFEHLRQTIATSMLRSGDTAADKDEVFDAIRTGLSDLKVSLLHNMNQDATLEGIQAMKEELEHLRETLTTTLVRSSSIDDKEEILEIMREGFDGIRADVAGNHDSPESLLSNTGEIVDAFNDGLEGLRADLERIVSKPLDMTVNYEILDTLKEGLTNIRADIDRLRSTEQEMTESRGGEVVVADSNIENLRRNDIENLEIMIAQLKIKVEALDNMPPPPPPEPQMPPPPPENFAVKEDLQSIEATLADIQAALLDLTQRDQTQREDLATRDDTDAIETLLRNTKAKIDEMLSAESDGVARVAQIEAVESAIKEMRDTVLDSSADKASKEDMAMLEVLLQELRVSIEEMREKINADDPNDRVSKSDFDALGTVCVETKTSIEELRLPDIDTLPTKEELEGLGDLIRSFAERREEEADLTARAFEARKIEHGGIADKVEDVKLFLDDVRAELKAKLNEDGQSIQELAKTLETLTETVVGTDAIPLVNELKDVVSREFECMHGNFAGSELEREQKHNSLLEKYDEQRASMTAELVSKIDDRFDEIMAKYDDARLAAEENQKAFREKETEHAEALNTTKLVAEDLRLLVDTLGTTVTDSCERMGEDSKTVFERIESMAAKLDELVAVDPGAEHQATRAELSNTFTVVEEVKAQITEYQPKILDSIKDLLTVIGQQYEQAKTSAEEIKISVNAIPAAIPLPAIAAPPSPPIVQEIPVFEKYDDAAVHAKLDQLVGCAEAAEIHAKLDQLVDRAEAAEKSLAQFALLDQIREQVNATANEFNIYVAKQQATIAQAADDRAKEAEAIAVALQGRISQKEAIEADIVRISEQRGDLADEVEVLVREKGELAREKEELALEKAKMQADLSSLQTALQIRREELQIMEARAEGLERRILDDILDHSRSLLTTSRPPSSLKDMNLKRVVSSATNTRANGAGTPGAPAPPSAASAVTSGIGMALKRRQPLKSGGSAAVSSKGDRRILSLSTIGMNQGANVERSMVLANLSLGDSGAKRSAFGLGGVKRSHSVKSNFPARKTSWGGTKALGMYGDDALDDEEDKENSVLDEEDEGLDDFQDSEAETERRTSYSGTYTDTMSYGDGSTVSGGDRRTSYAASTVGTVGTRDYAMTENEQMDSEAESIIDDEDKEQRHVNRASSAASGEVNNAGDMVVYGHHSDSGIGSDLPTATVEGGSEYFRE